MEKHNNMLVMLDPDTLVDQGCPYSDDSLSTKKVLPGFRKAARTPKSSKWQHRLKNSEDSCLILYQMIDAQWKATSKDARHASRKLTKQNVEDKSMVTALACT